MNYSTLKQINISVDTLIDKNFKNQSVSGIDFNVSINSMNISTKGISSVGVTITVKGCLKGTLFGNCGRQLIDDKIYRDVKYTKNMLYLLIDNRNKIFQCLSKKKYISEK